MYINKLSLLFLLLPASTLATGFTTYKQITEGADNSDVVAYSQPSNSNTLWVYVQILANGGDHTSLWNDYKSLVSNYAAKGIAVIPRVRYGTSDGDYGVEPSDANTIARDVQAWVGIVNETKSSVSYPLIQAGFLGQWGEWHDGPFSMVQGKSASSNDIAVKKNIISRLQSTGLKVALRYPADHAVFVGSRSSSVTIHDDCIFSEGPGGNDEGTYNERDGHDSTYWQSYTRNVAGGNGFGGEGCSGTYDWSDFSTLCGNKGIIPYINKYQIAYLNPLNPSAMQQLFTDPSTNATCLDAIQKALLSHQM